MPPSRAALGWLSLAVVASLLLRARRRRARGGLTPAESSAPAEASRGEHNAPVGRRSTADAGGGGGLSSPPLHARDDDRRVRAAETIKGWAACMHSRLNTAGRGEQTAEMLLVWKVQHTLCILCRAPNRGHYPATPPPYFTSPPHHLTHSHPRRHPPCPQLILPAPASPGLLIANPSASIHPHPTFPTSPSLSASHLVATSAHSTQAHNSPSSPP